MTTSRRRLIAAGATLALPHWRSRKVEGPGCHGRVAYAGGPLRPQLEPAVFDLAASVGGARIKPYASDDLDDRLDRTARALKSGTLGAAIARSDGTLWTQSVSAAGAPPMAFIWPGFGDVLVATVVLQLVEAGRLSLDSTIEKWTPDAPGARWITIEDLLSHTSGLSPTGAAAWCPGAGWSDTPADYALLARIAEAAGGTPIDRAIQSRIVDVLELRETKATLDAGKVTVSASPSDVVRFWRSLMANGLHGEAMTRRRFLRLYPMTAAPARSHWGLGVMVTDLAADRWNPADIWLGWARSDGASGCAMAFSPRKKAFAAVALSGEGSAESAIDLMMLDVKAEPTTLQFTPTPPRPNRRRPRPPPKHPRK